MKYNKIILFICLIFFVFVVPIIISQEPKITIEHTGYGETSRVAYFSIYNTGDIQLTNINVSVDKMLYKTIIGSFGPKIGLKTTLYLDPGQHMIELKTPEGAYDTINISISSAKEKTVTTSNEENNENTQIKKFSIIIVVLTIIFVVIAWILLRKPKLEMEQ